MSQSLKTLKVTEKGAFRALLVEVGPTLSGHLDDEMMDAGDEPVVPVQLHMPLSDARRFASMLFEWMELKASTASLELFPEDVQP